MSDPVEYLVADIGGTRLRAARAGLDGLRSDPVVLRNDGHDGILAALEATGLMSPAPAAICLAVAGPVGCGPDGAWIRMTNRPWSLTEAQVKARIPGADVMFLNDLQAIGHVLDTPGPLDVILPGEPVAGAPRLVVNAGTGVNAAVNHPGPHGALVPPSESGFLGPDFAGMEDWRACLVEDHGHAFADIALSGRGMSAAWRSLTGTPRPPEDITAAAAAGEADARAAMTLYWRLMGRYCRDLVLVHMATGGLYFHGSAVAAALRAFDADAFGEAFAATGAYAPMLRRIPVRAMRDDLSPLRGAANALAARVAAIG
ncbi:glucokinase [Pseudooceanicola aestuarii]|uniref:glucokinase n=1 Tax=Pseudooceanicola aestuarii TaxID=2697319 RepID=UPI0013D71166|nr:glucokinase [Pseudooceanicola aestuarii]